MQSFLSNVEMFFWNIIHQPNLADVIDILIMAALLYQLVMLTKQTRAIQVLKGLAVLLIISYVSELFGLTSLNWLMRSVLNNGALLLFIIFQPELRKVLEQVGRGAGFEHGSASQSENERIIAEITQCCLRLSKRRVGALIVFEQKTGLKDVIETGTALDASISAPLLENIFEPNTPLHDGAVIIRGQRIVAAACVLTLSESNALSRDLGTRHRAALGISEASDAVTLIVSEETGIVSLTKNGVMTRRLDAEGIAHALRELYHEEPTGLKAWGRKILRKGGSPNVDA